MRGTQNTVYLLSLINTNYPLQVKKGARKPTAFGIHKHTHAHNYTTFCDLDVEQSGDENATVSSKQIE
jgi:hypothetical protein